MESKNREILVIEDDPTVAAVLRASLGRAGYRVSHAWDGAEAVRLVHTESATFDMLISDVVLGDSTVSSTVKLIFERCPDNPVLLISGFPLEMLVERGYLAPADLDRRRVFFLQKPFLPSQLTAEVHRILTDRLPSGQSSIQAGQL
jgi:CheY-like chemotaxis protein